MAMGLTTTASLKEGDIVFAQKVGYIPWPAKVLEKSRNRSCLVQFILTDDRHNIPIRKIWPYNEQTKQQFVTTKTLEHDKFRLSIFIAEHLLGFPNLVTAYHSVSELNPSERHFIYEVRRQRCTLYVEASFIQHINQLRSSLAATQPNFAAAQLALQELIELPEISQLLLVRNQEAVESIRLLCCYVNLDRNCQIDPDLIRDMARQLMVRFKAAFKKPYSMPTFWAEYCKLANIYRTLTKPLNSGSVNPVNNQPTERNNESIN